MLIYNAVSILAPISGCYCEEANKCIELLAHFFLLREQWRQWCVQILWKQHKMNTSFSSKSLTQKGVTYNRVKGWSVFFLHLHCHQVRTLKNWSHWFDFWLLKPSLYKWLVCFVDNPTDSAAVCRSNHNAWCNQSRQTRRVKCEALNTADYTFNLRQCGNYS